MIGATFCLAVVAVCIAVFALIVALDARDFWRALLDDYRASERARARIDEPVFLRTPKAIDVH